MQPVYKVQVFFENKVDTYLFGNERAIRGSFATSWSKIGSPVYMPMDRHGFVNVYVNKEHVGRYSLIAQGDVHTDATHF